MENNLYKTYHEKVRTALQDEFKYGNVHNLPKLEKVVINMGVGRAVENSKLIDTAVADLELIAGQKPIVCKARKSVAGFKLREGMPIGVKVTLRRQKMYEFLEKLIHISLPRVRDFRGLNAKSFDGRGNYTFGVKEHIIFPEIDFDKIESMRGMDITIVTSAGTNEEASFLLKQLGMPLKSN